MCCLNIGKQVTTLNISNKCIKIKTTFALKGDSGNSCSTCFGFELPTDRYSVKVATF